MRTPALGAIAVLALAAGTALGAPSNRSTTPTLVADGPFGQVGIGKSRADVIPAASRPTRLGGAAPGRPSRYDAVWDAARARHPEPVVYAGTDDRPIDCLHLKCIALTFDDGPGPDTTDGLLEILAVEHVRATFFVLGQNVRDDPGPMIRAAWDGHQIGIHTWDHRMLPGRSVPDIADDITRTANEITRWSGVRPAVVRPPYGAIDDTTDAKVPYPLIIWSVDPNDWRDHDTKLVIKRVTAAGAPGSIVLMHDVYPTTVAAVPSIIAFYKARGYTFVTVSELYNSRLRPHFDYHGREVKVAAARARDARARIVRPPWVDPELRTTPSTSPDAGSDGSTPGAPTAPPADPATGPPTPSSVRRSSAGPSGPR